MSVEATLETLDLATIAVHVDDEMDTFVDPLPSGIIDEANNPEDSTIALHYRYTDHQEGAIYYFLTYDGIYLKAYSHLGMALAAFAACSQTWKKEYKRLLPQICHSYRTLLGDLQEPLIEDAEKVLAHALMKLKLRRY